MLLQLVEPGQTPLPHDNETSSLAVGIDLGTTHSLVSYVKEGSPHILEHETSGALLPSAVYYSSVKEVKVGREALEMLEVDASNVITSAKRFMGQGSDASTSNLKLFTTAQGPKNALQVSAEILKVLKKQAEARLGVPVSQAVITVPAYFDDTARTATRDAARLAGLEVLRLLNEPTAAALAYGLEKQVNGLYAVYDLGGGTFDFSLLRLEKGVFQVLATGGDVQLGGDDFDQALFHLINEKFLLLQEQLSFVPKELIKPIRDLKESLSIKTSVTQTIFYKGQDYKITINQEEYAQVLQPFLSRTLSICKSVIKDASVEVPAVKGVILVGGATRTPAVARCVKDFFGKEPFRNIDPDKAVAMGAALQAYALTHGSETLLLDVNPLSLGIETMGGLVEKIIPRNSPIPLRKAQEFTTFKDGQTAMMIHIVQGERELVQDCRSLARFELRGIPPMVAGAARICVTFSIDADGILTVSALEKTTGISQHVEVKPTYGLPEEEMNQMLLEAFHEGTEDMEKRLLAETKIEARQLLTSLETALKNEGYLLRDNESSQIKSLMAKLNEAQHLNDREQIKMTIKLAENESHFFAEKRIENAIEQALTGRRLEDIQNKLISNTKK